MRLFILSIVSESNFGKVDEHPLKSTLKAIIVPQKTD